MQAVHEQRQALDQPAEAPRAAAARISAIRTLMQEWSTERFVSAGHTPAARSLVADAGLELLAEISRLTAERDDARADIEAVRAHWQRELSKAIDVIAETGAMHNDARARADGYALLAAEYRASLTHAGAGLAATYAYLMQRGDQESAADVLTWIDQVGAILAADPEARASELLARSREGQP